MSESGQSKTEAASPRRREDARKRGQVASSADLSSGLFLLLMLGLMSFTSSDLAGKLTESFRHDFGTTILRKEWTLEHTVLLGRASSGFLIGSASVVLAGGFVIAILTSVLQIGFQVTPEAMSFKPNRLSPSSGAKRVFSLRGAMRTLMGIAKFTLSIVAMVGAFLSQKHVFFDGTQTLPNALQNAWDACLFSAMVGSLGILLVGSIDFLFQRWQHEEDLKMTKKEVKDEAKDNEGDPQIKARLRERQIESAQMRTLKEVANATVVVTNPTHYAVALKYDGSTMSAPKVVCKGKGLAAQRIKRVAQEAGVPILERKVVARALYATTEVDSEVPASLYRAIAEILAHVYGIGK